MKRNIVIAALTATALIGGGTATALAVGSDDDGATRQANVRVAADDDRDDDEAVAAAKSGVTASDAVTAALKHTPGTAASVDLDDDGAGAWEVDVLKGDGTEYSVKVSPDTGKVVSAHQDDDDNDSDDRAELAALKNAKTDAREAALTAATKGTVTEVSLDDDDDSRAVVWNVDTTKGEWKVDLTTGKLTADRDED